MSASAFDTVRPPDRAQIDRCVHCGFCLPTCPTYLLWGEEMDSPRGRIHLMKSGLDGRIGLTPRLVAHMDACLGCMACVTACPSGVEYGALIEATRAQIERQHTRRPLDRLKRAVVFALAPHPGRLRALLIAGWPLLALARLVRRTRVLGLLPAPLRRLVRLAPGITLRSLAGRLPSHTPAVGGRRLSVGLLTGCVQWVVFHEVNGATAGVLAAEGCDVTAPRQGCCGALELHSGREEAARARARRLIDAFAHGHFDRIVVNVAGCGSAMKEYGRLLADDPAWADRAREFSERVRDVSEVLAELGPPRGARHPIEARVAYHDACHLGHAQGVRSQPRAMLAAVPGLSVTDLAEGDICCGSAGIFNIVQPEPADALARRKAAHVASAGPDAVVTGNAGCLLQLAAGLREAGASRPVLHPVEVVYASLEGRALPSTTVD